MTKAETRYAQIEKEVLAMTFACERFHQYIFGQQIQIETDHKPLIGIFKKSLNDCPIRIQRLLLRLQRYSFDLTFTPGKYMFISDALSRAYVQSPTDKDISGEEEVSAYVDFIVTSLPVSDKKLVMIKEDTENDGQLQILKATILEGFPKEKSECPKTISEFWNFRTELSYIQSEGLIMKGSKVVIPHKMRKEMLQKIHVGHLGTEKCKRRALQALYWPGMNQSITEMVQACSTCMTYRPKQSSEPLMPHPVASYPWQKVGVDMCTANGKNYLVMCDYYSNYPEVCQLKSSTSSESVIKAMKYVFAGQGIPQEVFSDNGPQFNSHEFRQFARDYDFLHSTSSPRFPQSNGQVEKCVGIVKNLVKKSDEDKSDFHLNLLVYRTTPLETGTSPMELLNNGRQVRTNLPFRLEKDCDNARQMRMKTEQKLKQKCYFDKTSRSLPPLNCNDTVRIRDYRDGKWTIRATVERQVAPRSYIVKTATGEHYRRNRKDIMKTRETIPLELGDDMSVYEEDENDQPIPEIRPIPATVARRSCRAVSKPKRLIEEM